MAETPRSRLHLDDVALFRAALSFTAAETGFLPRLIEKDYFCTVILQCLRASEAALVFRGGTCLAKVHAGFYRLSEDLDFLIPTEGRTSRAERSRLVAPLKDALAHIGRSEAGLRVVRSLTGARVSTQYVAALGYRSLVTDQEDTIKVEVGLREPLLKKAVAGDLRTLLLDPISGSALIAPFAFPCLSFDEAMAEKLRAALSRREVAVRDFYDVDHAVRRLGLVVSDSGLADLVRQKLAVHGNDPADLSDTRRDELRRQSEAQLRVVLRSRDFAEFDLDRAYATVSKLWDLIIRSGKPDP